MIMMMMMMMKAMLTATGSEDDEKMRSCLPHQEHPHQQQQQQHWQHLQLQSAIVPQVRALLLGRRRLCEEQSNRASARLQDTATGYWVGELKPQSDIWQIVERDRAEYQKMYHSLLPWLGQIRGTLHLQEKQGLVKCTWIEPEQTRQLTTLP